MYGLIHSREYEANKQLLCGGSARLADMADAAEWRIQCAPRIDEFQCIKETPRGKVYVYAVPPVDKIPGLLIAFSTEPFQGTDKILLLDVRLVEVEDGPADS